MASSNKNKKHNYIYKHSKTIIALIVVLLCSFLKAIYLDIKCDLFGLGLYATCFIFFILMSIVFVLPIYYISKKSIEFRVSRGQIRNALQYTKIASYCSSAIGIVLMFLLLFIKNALGKFMHLQSLGDMIFIFFAFAFPFLLFISSMIGAFIGFGMQIPVLISAITFSFSDLIFSLIFSSIIGKYGNINSELFHNFYINTAFYGTGMAVGFLIGTIIPCFFLFFVLKSINNSIKNGTIEKYGKNSEKARQISQNFFTTLGQTIIQYLLPVFAFASIFIFTFYYSKISIFEDENHIARFYGICYIQLILLFIIPLFIGTLLAKHAKDILTKSMAKQDRYHGGMRLIGYLKQYICVVLPLVSFIGIISSNLIEDYIGASLKNLTMLIILIFALISLSSLLYAFLKGFDKQVLRYFSYIAGIIAEYMYIIFVLREDFTIQNILLSIVIYIATVCIVDFLFLYKYFVYRKQLLRHIGYPIFAYIVFILVSFTTMFLRNTIGTTISILIAFTFAFIAHSIVLVLTGCITKHEMTDFPQQRTLLLLGKITGTY